MRNGFPDDVQSFGRCGSDDRVWHIASFRCCAAIGRIWSEADIKSQNRIYEYTP